MQVKYEMVRRVSVDGAPVTATAAAFGSTPKAANLPAPERGKEEDPPLSLRPSPGPAAAEPGPFPAGLDSPLMTAHSAL